METNIIEKTAALRPSIASLKVGEWIDLPKEIYTAAAARKAVQRLYEQRDFDGTDAIIYSVSETAYPGGTRVTRIQ